MNRVHLPRILRIVAALFIAAGAASLVKMAAALMNGNFVLDLEFIGIPIGHGMLLGRKSSWRWALFFAGLGLLIAMAVIVAIQVPIGGIDWLPDADERRLAIIYMGVAIVILGFSVFGLLSRSVQAWFNADARERQDGAGWTLPLVVAGVLGVLPSISRDACCCVPSKTRPPAIPLSHRGRVPARTDNRCDSRPPGRDQRAVMVGYSCAIAGVYVVGVGTGSFTHYLREM
jgi:hypothetical protein